MMESSMGYTCSQCKKKTFLIGWKHTETNKNHCDDCKAKSADKDNFVEKIY